MSIILLIAYVLATSFGLVLIKLGTTSGLPIAIVEHGLKFNLNLSIISGILLYCLSFVLYIYLISKFDLGFIIPVTTALVYSLVFLASFFIFHEVFTVMKIAAISLIIFGVILLNLNK
jgi:drug/metabolite transporter (DMT)-like permease